MTDKIKEYLQEYGKPAATVGSAGLAGFAAIDQALQGDTEMMQMLAENSELIDNIGHQATGVFGAIAAEYGYSALKEEEDEEGFGKYAVMLAGAYAAGGLGQASQYVISGTPEFLAATESMTGGLYATVAQMGADSHDRNLQENEKTQLKD